MSDSDSEGVGMSKGKRTDEAFPPGHYTHGELTPETHPALFAAIAEAFGPPPVPPPDVYEFYRRHGRWPKPGEA